MGAKRSIYLAIAYYGNMYVGHREAVAWHFVRQAAQESLLYGVFHADFKRKSYEHRAKKINGKRKNRRRGKIRVTPYPRVVELLNLCAEWIDENDPMKVESSNRWIWTYHSKPQQPGDKPVRVLVTIIEDDPEHRRDLCIAPVGAEVPVAGSCRILHSKVA